MVINTDPPRYSSMNQGLINVYLEIHVPKRSSQVGGGGRGRLQQEINAQIFCSRWRGAQTRFGVVGGIVVHRVSSSLLGPVVPSFRTISGRLAFTARRHKSNKDSLS